ncbi:hypothetical protein [Candidatus Lokiarchaeum ossiferum]|uniref:hypothetical protein n=1 Tax=Candidatus Lokiarchaeum ossiferum TaxID=2951803 RepID=UPI00352CB39D
MNNNELPNDLIIAIDEQFGAALAMMKEVICKCPEHIWNEKSQGPPFWHISYHALYFLDLYLCFTKEERESFQPFFRDMSHRVGNTPKIPLESYQVKEYLEKCSKKARKYFSRLEIQDLYRPSVFEWHGTNILSSLIYNLRHLMLHIGTLNYRVLRADVALDNWVSEKKNAFADIN